jgi:hypothetical protein
MAGKEGNEVVARRNAEGGTARYFRWATRMGSRTTTMTPNQGDKLPSTYLAACVKLLMSRTRRMIKRI